MKRWWILLFIVLVPVALLVSSLNDSLNEMPLNRQERLSSVITTEEARPFMLGYSSVVADYIWIRTMLYFGGNYGSGDIQYIEELINSVIALNPRFYPPYEFAGVILPDFSENYDYPRRTLSYGMNRVPENSERLAFYLAYINYKNLSDDERAADLLTYAATADFAPSFWGKFAATLYSDSDQPEDGLLFLYSLLIDTESPQVQEQLRAKIAETAADHDIPFFYALFQHTESPEIKEEIQKTILLLMEENR